MSKSTLFGALGLALVLAGASGCSSKKAAIYEHEHFDDSGTFSRSFAVSDAGSCEAARRALLSQGYIITSNAAGQVNGNKSFQQNSESHLQISFNVTCAPDNADEQRSTMFANALQDRYALKKSNTSASLGVGVLGSLSMPIGSTDDSMVKVASETVTSAQFYDRYFALVESFLPKPKTTQAQPAVVKPVADIGVPEPSAAALAPVSSETPAAVRSAVVEPVTAPAAPAQASTTAPVAEPAATQPPIVAPVSEAPAAPVLDDSHGSQPVAPPAEAAPFQVEQQAPLSEEAPAPL